MLHRVSLPQLMARLQQKSDAPTATTPPDLSYLDKYAKYRVFYHPPPPIDPRAAEKREIRRIIGEITNVITDLHDRHFIDQFGHKCFGNLCSIDCRRHHCCAMKYLDIAIKIRDYHERVKEEQEASHAQKEEEVSHLPCRFRMRIQHADRKLRTQDILKKKENIVADLVDFLKPFINKHTTALLEHCASLLTFELVQSNQEAMSKIALLQQRIIEFKEHERWTSRELVNMEQGTYLHKIQF
jgi:hypothetical protein